MNKNNLVQVAYFSVFWFVCVFVSLCLNAYSNTPLNYAQKLLAQAQKYEESSPVEAMKICQEALSIARQEKDIDTQVRALMFMGLLEQSSRRLETAITYLEEVVNLLSNTADTDHRALAFSHLASLYRDVKKFDMSLEASKNSVIFAEQSTDDYLKFRGYTSLGNSYKNVKEYSLSLEGFQVSKEYAIKLDNTKYKLIAYTNLARANKRLENIEASLAYNKKALSLSEQTGNLEDIALYLEYISTDLRKLGLYAPALPYAIKALSVQRERNKTHRVSVLLLNISIIYRRLGSYDKALAYASELVTLQKKQNNIDGLASAYNSIGHIYNSILRYDESLRYYEMTLALPENKVGIKNRASALRSIADILQLKGDYGSALESALESKKLYAKINSISGANSVNRSIGIVYVKLGDHIRAKESFDRSLELSRQLKDLWSEAATLIQLGKLFKGRNPDKSMKYAKEAIAISLDVGYFLMALEGYQILMEYEKQLGDYQNAYGYSNLMYKTFNKMSITDINKRTEEIRILAELERQEKEVERLHREAKIKKLQLESASAKLVSVDTKNTISNLQLQKSHYIQILLLGVSIVFFVCLVVLYSRYKSIRKDQKILNQKNQQIAYKNKELEEVSATKDRFLSIIAHDLRGPMAALVSLSDTLHENFYSYTPEKIHNYIHVIYESSLHSYSLLNELLDWAMQQLRNTDPVPRLHAAAALCNGVVGMLDSSAKKKNVTVNVQSDNASQVYVDKNMIVTVIRNLMVNALKITPKNGAINIFFESKPSFTMIHIKDSGLGIKDEDLHHLFDVESSFSRGSVVGAEFGLSLCKDLVTKNGGNIFVSSKQNEGGDFYLELPNVK